MSKKSTANPLLIRHRYLNPFPPPPFPPKLLLIPTDTARYAGYRLLAQLESEREIQMPSETDVGMPIEPGRESDGTYGLGLYWEGHQDVVCPDPSQSRPELDPEDAVLLMDPSPVPGASISIMNGTAQSHPTSSIHTLHHMPASKGSPLFTNTPNSAHGKKTDVAWLRRTEYFNDAQPKSRDSPATKNRLQLPLLPKMKSERLVHIHASFDELAKHPLETLKHPTKRHLKPVESFDCLPNATVWGNTYDFYRFQENPTDRKDALSNPAANQVDHRLDLAIMRPVPPVQSDSRLAYYLPEKVEGALRYKKLKLDTNTVDQGAPQSPNRESSEPTHDLHLVREYDVGKQKEMNQHLLVFDHGDSGRPRAAYFNPIAQFSTLRKRRPRIHGQRPVDDLGDPLWDGICVSLSQDVHAIEVEKTGRQELVNLVTLPPPELLNLQK